MCGVTGFIDLTAKLDKAALETTARNMADVIASRGPDAAGVWVDAKVGVALGHRRLSIIELSPAGAQPMVSASDRFVISYNGEIYNFAQLRAELSQRGASFRGNSDTEVLIEACEAWGVENAVERLVGMFAFALWDRRDQQLTLVRDRLGIKPLYWGQIGTTLFFGSQPKSFARHPAWTGQIDQTALSAFFRFGYVPAPLSIFAGFQQLPPGEILVVQRDGSISQSRYWDASEKAREGVANRIDPNDDDAIEELEDLLRDAVGSRMIADVPLGAFLSGGVDSSTVVAMMQELSPTPVRTFSIGFPEDRFNEATYAKDVARHLGTDHEELYVDWKTALDVVPRLPEWFDEPFADSSQIPTFLVSQMARKSVKTVLSGDGGDEVFAGYSRYFLGNSLWRRIGALPPALRKLGSSAICALPERGWDGLGSLLPARHRPPHFGYRAHKLAAMLRQPNAASFYRLLVSQWSEPGQIMQVESSDVTDEWEQIVLGIDDPTERMQLLDLVTYLPGDILTKVDRASMAVSLEARVPLLDHRIVEYAARLPMRFKIRNGESKWLLRQVLYRRVPRALIERPKMGFGVPIGEWLRGPLREWAEDLLSTQRLAESGLLNPGPIRHAWHNHVTGKVQDEYRLWCVLMFQAWRSANV